MPEMPVKFPFIGIDKVSPAVSKMDKRVEGFGDRSRSIFRRMRSDALSVKGVMSGILGARVVGAGFSVIRNQIRTITDELIDFDHALTKAGARYGIDRYSDQFRQMGKVAREVGAKTRFTAAEAATTLDKFAMSGFKANEAMKLSLPASKLAVAADLDIASAAEIAATSLAVFGKKADEFTGVADVLAFTANSTKTNLRELFEVLRSGGAAKVGGSTSTFSAIARAMADFKIVGERAGTAMKTGLLRLSTGGRQADAELKRIGLKTYDIVDGKKESRDIMTLLEDLENKYKKMGSRDVAASMRKIFGLEAYTGMSKIFQLGIARIKEYKNQAESVEGYVDSLADKMGMSYENKIKEIQSAAVEVGFTIIDAFGKDIPGALQSAIDAIRGIDTKKIKEDMKWAKDTAKEAVGFLKSAYPIMKSVAIIWAGFKFRNAMSVMSGTFRDLRDRSSEFRRNINGINTSLDETNRKFKIAEKHRGKGFGVYTQPTGPAAIGKGKQGLGSRIGRSIPAALGAAPVIMGGVAAWISVYDALTEDVKNRIDSYWKKSEQAMFAVGSWGRLEKVYESRSELGGKAKIFDEVDKINDAYNAVSKSMESLRGIDLFSDWISKTFFGLEKTRKEQLDEAQSELITKKNYMLDAFESAARREAAMDHETPYPIYNQEMENRRVLGLINVVEANFDSKRRKDKLEVETTIRFEGNVPAGATAETKTKSSPGIDTSRLGKNNAA